MKICPTCRRCYEDADTACEEAGHGVLAPSRPGSRVVDGKYRLDRLLGRGGRGAVYSGVHIDLERPAAIKLLHPDLAGDPQALERFKREARAAARLNHPNLAGVYDYGTLPGGESYIVMELVEGETLRDRLEDAGALPAGEAVLVARQVADGVEAAHTGGVVHRDLKPSNVVVSRDQRGEPSVKVLDFGVAKLKGHATGRLDANSAGAFVGTPRYMSPEQCAGRDVDARSDVYSLGVMLYEMLAGRAPFDAPSATALALKQIQEPPPPLKESRPDVPDTLERLVMRALAKDPADRPQTAAEFSRALHAAEEQLEPSPSLLEEAPPRPEVVREGDRVEVAPHVVPAAKRRRRLRLVLAAVFVFLVSAIGAVLFLKWRDWPAAGRVNVDAPAPSVPSPSPTPEAAAAADARPAAEVTPTPAATPEKKEQAPATGADKKALQTALEGWVAATNSRDIKSQLAYYAPRLDVFYRERGVTREAVLGEKKSTFGHASRVSVTVADPSFEVGRDGVTAVTRFRKRYVIESGGKRRSGEVLQELHWARARSGGAGWKITGERDVQVIR